MLIALTTISRTLSQQYGLDGVENDEDVECQRQILDVEKVVLQFLQRVLDAGAVGVPDLGPAGEAWPDDMTLPVERNLTRELADELWPRGTRPDETHVTFEDIPQLRQFIEPRATQEMAD